MALEIEGSCAASSLTRQWDHCGGCCWKRVVLLWPTSVICVEEKCIDPSAKNHPKLPLAE